MTLSLRQHPHRGSEQYRLADQVHRHRRALQQQELQQHWPDVVDAGQGGAELRLRGSISRDTPWEVDA